MIQGQKSPVDITVQEDMRSLIETFWDYIDSFKRICHLVGRATMPSRSPAVYSAGQLPAVVVDTW